MRDMREEWVCGEKYKKCNKPWVTCQNTDPVSGTIWSTMDSKKCPKTAIFPDALFLQLPQDLLTFSDMGSFQTPKKALFHQRSYSKSPNHASGKVFKQRNTLYVPKHRIALCFNETWTRSWAKQNSRSRFVRHRATQLKLESVESKKHNGGLWKNWSQLGILCTRLLTETCEHSIKVKNRTDDSTILHKMKLESKNNRQKLLNFEIIMIIALEKCFLCKGKVGVYGCQTVC